MAIRDLSSWASRAEKGGGRLWVGSLHRQPSGFFYLDALRVCPKVGRKVDFEDVFEDVSANVIACCGDIPQGTS